MDQGGNWFLKIEKETSSERGGAASQTENSEEEEEEKNIDFKGPIWWKNPFFLFLGANISMSVRLCLKVPQFTPVQTHYTESLSAGKLTKRAELSSYWVSTLKNKEAETETHCSSTNRLFDQSYMSIRPLKPVKMFKKKKGIKRQNYVNFTGEKEKESLVR